jgi:hypothetical protein
MLMSDILSPIAKMSEKHSIVLLGDSHTTGCADKIKDHLNKNFSVTSSVKPGSDILTLTAFAKGAIEGLTKNDVLVFGGGGGAQMMLV